MKRVGKEGWERLCAVPTLMEAIVNAARGKKSHEAVMAVLSDVRGHAERLSAMLRDGTFSPSPLSRRVIRTEYGKEREIAVTPFWPDCCVHHAIALVMGERWRRSLTDDTYACIKGRGINAGNPVHNMNRKVRAAIRTYRGRPLHCLKMDVRKCYPSVDNAVLAATYRRHCKDKRLLALMDAFNFAGTPGLPIGSFMSQLWINVYLDPLDRFVKGVLGARHYFRYMDDMVVLHEDKATLHSWQWRIMNFMWYTLHLEANGKRRVFPVGPGNALDFGGYVFHRTHTLVRKRIKKSFARKRRNAASVASYMGILCHCDALNLTRKVLENGNEGMDISELGIRIERPFEGERIPIDAVLGRKVELLDFEVRDSRKKPGTSYIKMQVRFDGRKRFIGGGYQFLAQVLAEVPRAALPLDVTILNDKGYYFEGTIVK